MSAVEPVPTSPTAQSRAAVLAALSDVVTVTDPNNSDAAPMPLRPAPAPNAKGGEGFGSRVAGAFGKLRGNKKGARGADGSNAKSGSGTAADKGPSRIDVIDRLDASGLHGLSLFHHDSPYDACSPHSNRHATRAPVKAFTVEEGVPGVPSAPQRSRGGGQSGSGGGGSRQNLSPLAQATLQRMNAADADLYAGDAAGASGVSPNIRTKPPVHRSHTMDSYNSASTPTSDSSGEKPIMGRAQSSSSEFSNHGPPTLSYQEAQASAHRAHDRNLSSSSAVPGSAPRNGYMTAASAYPTHERSDESHPLAEVWGIVPEPWQEFATPAAPSRPKNGQSGGGLRAGNGANGSLSPYGDGHDSGTPSAASSVLDMEAVMTGKTKESSSSSAAANNATGGRASGLGPSEGTIRRPGGRNGNLARSTSAGQGAVTADGSGLDPDDSGDFVIEAGVSPFPEPNYGTRRDDLDDVPGYGAYGAGATGTKRSKSLIKRMKSARQNPNMPALKLDTANVAHEGSPSTHTPTDPRRLRHLSSPVMASPGAAGAGGAASRASPLEPQWEEGRAGKYGGGGGGSSSAGPAGEEGTDYLDAYRGRAPVGGAGGLSPSFGGAGRSYSPGTPGGSGLGRSGSLFSKLGRKARA